MNLQNSMTQLAPPNLLMNHKEIISGTPPMQSIGYNPTGQMQIPYAFMNGNGGYIPPPMQSIGYNPYGQMQIPYVPINQSTSMVSHQLQPPMNILGTNGQIQATPNFMQSGCQNLDYIEELKKKIKKNPVLKKECKDFTFIISNTNGIYIFFKRNNKEWIEKFSRKLWKDMKFELIYENKVIFIPLIYTYIEKNITDEEIIYFLTNIEGLFLGTNK